MSKDNNETEPAAEAIEAGHVRHDVLVHRGSGLGSSFADEVKLERIVSAKVKKHNDDQAAIKAAQESAQDKPSVS